METNKLFIEYSNIANAYNGQHSQNNKEWHYILSNLDNNVSLIEKLEKNHLLQKSIKICDAGLGLGTALFDLYLQSTHLDKNFEFWGIEKNLQYTNFIKNNLLHLWQSKLHIIEGDLTNQNYSSFDIVYSFLPYKNTNLLNNFYRRVCNDLKPGALFIENSVGGKNSKLVDFKDMQVIDLGNIYVFKKI